MKLKLETSPLPATVVGNPPAGGPPRPPLPCFAPGEMPEPYPPMDEIICVLSFSHCSFEKWLKQRIDSLAYADTEDVVQDSIIRVHFEGIGILGMEHLSELGIEAADLPDLKIWFFEVLAGRFRRFIYRRGIDLVRRRQSIKMGGGFLHVDIDGFKDVVEGNSVVVTTGECAEAFNALIEWLEESVSIRERIVVTIYLTFLPVRPTVDEIYDELTADQMVEFLPRGDRDLAGQKAEVAIKSQISRTRASVEGKMKGFGDSQR